MKFIGTCQQFTLPTRRDFNENYCKYLLPFHSFRDSRRQVLFIKQEVNTIFVRNVPQKKGNVGKNEDKD